MQYTVCCVPVSALRKEPSHRVEMVSQQLFGECSTILEYIPGWIKIKCKYDNYEGWCQDAHVIEIDEDQFLQPGKKLAGERENEIDYKGEKMMIPFGSSLATFKKNKVKWQNHQFIYNGKSVNPGKEKLNKKNIRSISLRYQHTAYLWGGKSIYGIDCSGFSQSVYKFLNIYLPRDAWQQAELGNTIDLLNQANCGDLCFFDNQEGRIIHVGILLNDHQVIHASGKVRIDKIDDSGIINIDTKQRTHKLKVIKRYF